MISDLTGAVDLASGFESRGQGLVRPDLVEEAIKLGLGKPSEVTDEMVDRVVAHWIQVGRHGGVEGVGCSGPQDAHNSLVKAHEVIALQGNKLCYSPSQSS